MEFENNQVWQLHLRSSRREALSEEEQARLQAWYAEMDREEAAQLGLSATTASVAELEAQVKNAERQVLELIRQNQIIAAQNEAIRANVAVLRRKLEGRIPAQPVS